MHTHTKVSKAVFWSASDVFLRYGLGFFISIVLARLVTPEEFGLIAMLMLFTAIAGLFVESGFASALIQRQGHTYTDECTVFWFNMVAGVSMALLLVLIAPWLANFYGHPILEPLTKLMALNLWLSAFLTVPSALLTKKLDFKTQMKAQVSGSLISGVLAISLAFKGLGVWAIAIQTLSATFVSGLALWHLNSWRPSWIFSWRSFKNLFSFGGFLMLSGLLEVISTRLYTLIIGKSYGALDLGYFYRASNTKDLPQNVLSGIFTQVAFPVFSAQADDPEKLRQGLQVALITTMAINLPVMAGLLVTADELVPILFGPRWEASIPILKILCGLGAFWPLHLANLTVLKAMGHSRLILKIQTIKKILFITTLIMTSQISVLAIAWGMFILGLVGVLINTWYTQKYLSYGFSKQLKALTPYLLLTITMMLSVVASQHIAALSFDSIIPAFLFKFSIGFLVYGLLSYLFKLNALEYARQFAQQLQGEANR